MKRLSFLLHVSFSIIGFFLVQNVSLAVDPPTGTSLWRITADIWQRSSTCQSMLDGMESKFDTLSSKVCVLDSKIVTESTFDILSSAIDYVVTESALDPLLSKICVLDSKIDSIDTQIDSECKSTSISSATTIKISGSYCLANDITDGSIIIDADNVAFDLNCFKISDASYGIVINSDHSDITINNGKIGGGIIATQFGISIAKGCARISIKNVTIVDCEYMALAFAGVDSFSIKTIDVVDVRIENSGVGLMIQNVSGGFIKNCCMLDNIAGLVIDKAREIIVSDCRTFGSTQSGFELRQSSNNSVCNCKSFDNGGVGGVDVFAFVSKNGSNNIFQYCFAQDTKSNNMSVSKKVAGFALIGTEQKSVITDCLCKQVREIDNDGILLLEGVAIPMSSNLRTFGIFVDDSAQKCVVRDTFISGVFGGNGSSGGCIADGSNNLIIRNIGYGNGHNDFDLRITNVYFGGLAGDPNALDNLSLTT